jgi:hypothetical protein
MKEEPQEVIFVMKIDNETMGESPKACRRKPEQFG